MVWPEAHILMMNHKESANQKPVTDKKKHGQRDFSGDHHGPQTAMRTARGSGAALIFEARVDIGARRVQRWNQTTQQRRGTGDRQREEHDVPIQAYGYSSHVIIEAHVCPDKVDAPMGQKKSRSSSEERDDQTFGQQLPDNA